MSHALISYLDENQAVELLTNKEEDKFWVVINRPSERIQKPVSEHYHEALRDYMSILYHIMKDGYVLGDYAGNATIVKNKQYGTKEKH